MGRVGGHPVPVAVGPSNRERETLDFFNLDKNGYSLPSCIRGSRDTESNWINFDARPGDFLAQNVSRMDN